MTFREWSIRRWFLVIALIFLVPLIGLRLRLKWQVHRAVAELRASGAPTRYDDLNQAHQISDPDQNFAAALTNAMAMFSEGDTNLIERIPYWGEADRPRNGEPWPDEMRSAVSNYFRINREGMDRLRSALMISNACYFEDYNPEHWSIRSVVDAKTAAYRLGAAAAYSTEMGDHERATRDLVGIIHLADTLAREPAIICRLVCMGVETLGTEFLEDCMSRGHFSPDELRSIRAAVRRRVSDFSLEDSIRGERVFFLEPAFYGNGNDALTVSFFMEEEPDTLEHLWERFKVVAYRLSGFADQDVVAYIRATQAIEKAAAESAHRQYELSTNWGTACADMVGTRFHYWTLGSLEAYERILSGNFETQTKLRAADAALAVAEFRLDHEGRLPESLNDLVPQYLESVPLEPRSGQPFELIKTTDGFGIGRGTAVFKGHH